MSGFDPATRVCIGHEVLCRRLGDEAVLLHTPSGYYFNLNQTGATIWQSLVERGSLAAALEALESHFDSDPGRMQMDLLSLMGKLLANDLLTVESRG